MRDHPGDFLTKCGYDIYLNPWWGVKTARSQDLVFEMDKVLGTPDLWYQGVFHELLWGPRDLPRGWRPGFNISLSGTNCRLWRSFWLPWRMHGFWHPSCYPDEPKPDADWNASNPPLPYHANVQDEEVIPKDVAYVERYCEAIPLIRQYLATGKISTLLTMAEKS